MEREAWQVWNEFQYVSKTHFIEMLTAVTVKSNYFDGFLINISMYMSLGSVHELAQLSPNPQL